MLITRILIIQMDKEIKELTKQRDLAESRIEDLLRMVGKDQISKKVIHIS
jgi:centromeric protein E